MGASKFEEGILELEKALELSGNMNDVKVDLATAYAASGRMAEAETILHELEEESKNHYVSPILFATLNASLGRRDKTLEWLEKAHKEKAGSLFNVLTLPVFDFLRSETRFLGLQQKLGLKV